MTDRISRYELYPVIEALERKLGAKIEFIGGLRWRGYTSHDVDLLVKKRYNTCSEAIDVAHIIAQALREYVGNPNLRVDVFFLMPKDLLQRRRKILKMTPEEMFQQFGADYLVPGVDDKYFGVSVNPEWFPHALFFVKERDLKLKEGPRIDDWLKHTPPFMEIEDNCIRINPPPDYQRGDWFPLVSIWLRDRNIVINKSEWERLKRVKPEWINWLKKELIGRFPGFKFKARYPGTFYWQWKRINPHKL